jgi:outer membrane protein assembly factor BamD
MSRRIHAIFPLVVMLALATACTNKKVNNPLANVGSKQPDKVLFDRAMDAMKHNRFDVARLTLQTLINAYPDSEYIARAKLAVADSWYAEGGNTALAQAEIEYKDFETFFPNMPEAAEAQLKIANIHYQEMEKPDRDYTHAMRAEEEYRQLILQYPDNQKVVDEGKKRLLEVQEVIAEREFRVGRFYFLRESYPAAIARLASLADKYPLYSKADETLYLLGQAYEGEIALLQKRATCTKLNPPTPPGCVSEANKAAFVDEVTKNAAQAYSRILTRYPLMDRAEDAKARLEALHQPVPRPTKAAVAQNKAEEDSRRDTSMMKSLMGNFQKHPDVAQATKVGEPVLVDPQMVTARDVVEQAARAMKGPAASGPGNTVSVESVRAGEPPPNQPPPRSDSPNQGTQVENSAGTSGGQADSNELKPNVPANSNGQAAPAADPNELKPNVSSDNSQPPAAPPQQVNEIQPGAGATAEGANGQTSADGRPANASSSGQEKADDAAISSSKHKKKKGLKKVVPF